MEFFFSSTHLLLFIDTFDDLDCLIVISFSPYGRVRIRCFREPSFPDGTLKSADFSVKPVSLSFTFGRYNDGFVAAFIRSMAI